MRELLVRNSEENDCEELTCNCYSNLIEDVFGYEPVFVPYDITVGEFAKTHRQGIYLVRMDGHISVIMNGKSYDVFDCTNEMLTNAWRVE